MVNDGTPEKVAMLVTGHKTRAVFDDPFLLDLITELLDGAGLEVLTAESGAQALELTAARPPHLVLMDVSMAGLSGPETVRRLRASPATRAIPVVAMTGSTDATEMMAAGCVGYIPKPFRADRFPRLVWGFLQATTLRPRRPE